MKISLISTLFLFAVNIRAELVITNNIGESRANGELVLREMNIKSGSEIETGESSKVLISDQFGNKITILNSTKAVIFEGKKSLGVQLERGSIYVNSGRGFQAATNKNLLKLESGELLFSYDPLKITTLVVAFKGSPIIRRSLTEKPDAEKMNFFELKEGSSSILDHLNIPVSDNLSEPQIAFLRKNLNQIGINDTGFSIQRSDNVVDTQNHAVYSGEVLESDKILRDELNVDEILIKPNDAWTNNFNVGFIKSVEFYSVLSDTKEIRSKSEGMGFKAGYNFSNNYESVDFGLGVLSTSSKITDCIGCLKTNLNKVSNDSLLGAQFEYSKLINKSSLWGTKLSGEQGVFYTLSGSPSKKTVFKILGNYDFLLNQDLSIGFSGGLGKLDDIASGFSGEAKADYRFDLSGEQFEAFFKVMYERYEGNGMIYKSERFHLGIQFEF